MSNEVVISRLRKYLLALTCAMCVGVVLELWLTDHLKEPLQFIPFALCALCFITALMMLIRPTRLTIWALRIVMLITAFGGLLGSYQHIIGNYEFALETNPIKASTAPLAVAFTGANPPFAPGALGVLSLVALAATYAHPALNFD
jgi:hypothetical protein